jgi:hypothetical protein
MRKDKGMALISTLIITSLMMLFILASLKHSYLNEKSLTNFQNKTTQNLAVSSIIHQIAHTTKKLDKCFAKARHEPLFYLQSFNAHKHQFCSQISNQTLVFYLIESFLWQQGTEKTVWRVSFVSQYHHQVKKGQVYLLIKKKTDNTHSNSNQSNDVRTRLSLLLL